jgi:hypothetical protein
MSILEHYESLWYFFQMKEIQYCCQTLQRETPLPARRSLVFMPQDFPAAFNSEVCHISSICLRIFATRSCKFYREGVELVSRGLVPDENVYEVSDSIKGLFWMNKTEHWRQLHSE